MKIILLVLAVIGLAGFALSRTTLFTGKCTKPASFASTNEVVKSAATAGNGFAVVELFTSEGCSSCPSADALLAKLDAEQKKNVYVLSYHVDYWDRLGWKDAFSKPEWTARQAAYVQNFQLESAYTPEAVVNGSKEFVGSSKAELYTALDKELLQSEALALKASAVEANRQVAVSVETPAKDNITLNVALVQLSASSDVVRGENSGRHLAHINVVRVLKTVNAAEPKTDFRFDIPSGFKAGDFKIIAFAQNKKDLKITAATEAAIL